MFGAGHVGQAVARLAARLPLQLGWFDNRPELAARPGVMLGEPDALVQCVSAADAKTAVVILTHDHALDYRLAAAALRGQARFVGLIGSRTKRARFQHRLAEDGFDEAARARVHCPIGIAGITGKEPEVIAVAIVAQLLALGASR
jgi:xanthine dehydrogenase accessory factor